MRSLLITLLLATSALRGAPDQASSGPAVVDGHLVLGFDRLAGYRFVVPAFDPAAHPGVPTPTGEEQIPASVKAWNGKNVIVTGFMLPVKLEKGLATVFLLMANQMACCYGATPAMNEWVIVLAPQGVQATEDVPISFRGRFKVGAVLDDGYLSGIYQLEAEGPGKVADPLP